MISGDVSGISSRSRVFQPLLLVRGLSFTAPIDAGAIEVTFSVPSFSFAAALLLRTALSSAALALAANVVPNAMLARLAAGFGGNGLVVEVIPLAASSEYDGLLNVTWGETFSPWAEESTFGITWMCEYGACPC